MSSQPLSGNLGKGLAAVEINIEEAGALAAEAHVSIRGQKGPNRRVVRRSGALAAILDSCRAATFSAEVRCLHRTAPDAAVARRFVGRWKGTDAAESVPIYSTLTGQVSEGWIRYSLLGEEIREPVTFHASTRWRWA